MGRTNSLPSNRGDMMNDIMMKVIGQRPLVALIIVIAARFLFATSAFADSQVTFSPQGVQKVMVIPIEYPTTNPCPIQTLPCPGVSTTTGFFATVGPPRHSAAEWERLLNSIARDYWQRTTYNQTEFQFVVEKNPLTTDGWWPPPHTIQDYVRNDKGGNWSQDNNTPPSYAQVPDVTASVAQSICSNPILVLAGVCSNLKTFNRLLVITNVHSFGAQSYGSGSLFAIPTGTSLGTLTMTASIAQEGDSDNDIAAMLHELGHQLGELSHYGDCSHYFTFTSFNTIPPAGAFDCLDLGWDVMGLSYSFVQLSGYSMVSRGWIDPNTTISHDLLTEGPFTDTVNLHPLETSATPNVIRLSLGDLSWPDFWGYFVECRERFGEDVSSPFPSINVDTLRDEGVLITNVHELTVTDPVFNAPAHHIERPLFPDDHIGAATLKPGDTFSDHMLGLSVRFNGYITPIIGELDTGAPPLCSISIAHETELPPPPFFRRIQFAGNFVLNRSLGQAGDSTSIPVDVAFNNLIDAVPMVTLPVPVEPPWVGHDNSILVRVHNRSSGPIQDVRIGASANQPATITDTCGAGPPTSTMETLIPTISSASSALANMDWIPTQSGSVSIDVSAEGPGNQINTSSRFSFQFHHLDTLGRGINTQLKLKRDFNCMPESLFIAPAVQFPGWQVLVSPSSVFLNPGEDETVNIRVIPPPSAEVGYHAEIPVVVTKLATRFPYLPSPDIIAPGTHFETLGALTILARVTGGPASSTLNVPDTALVNTPVPVSGAISPGSANSPITIEYRSPSGQVIVHIVKTNAAGGYSDTITPVDLGPWTVQSRWPGDNEHDPVESLPNTFLVYANSVGGGAFVIGDISSRVGVNVTFWGAQWSKANILSGGPAPDSFKGFENMLNTPSSCGGTWSTLPGNSSIPPSNIPTYMSVIASGSVSKKGMLITGDVRKMVVVKSDRGYSADSGHAGTGAVVSVICEK
jgi:hypothetical protein